MNLKEILNLDAVLIDGAPLSNVQAVQVTASKGGDNLCTVFFNVNEKPRTTTLELDAVSFNGYSAGQGEDLEEYTGVFWEDPEECHGDA